VSASFAATAADAFRRELTSVSVAPKGEKVSLEGLGDPQELGRRAALLALAEAAWRRHLGVLLDSAEVQKLLKVGTRQAVSDLAKRGRILGLPTAGGRWLFPAFQFGPGGRPHAVLPAVLKVFQKTGVSPYTVASWFRTAQGTLDGKNPLEWLAEKKPEEDLLRAAARTAARFDR
jgi:hypothetical protein